MIVYNGNMLYNIAKISKFTVKNIDFLDLFS